MELFDCGVCGVLMGVVVVLVRRVVLCVCNVCIAAEERRWVFRDGWELAQVSFRMCGFRVLLVCVVGFVVCFV